MKVFLAATSSHGKFIFTRKLKIPYVLESYFYAKPWQMAYIRQPFVRDFMLDSGAFTMLSGKGFTKKRLDKFVQGYINFINFYDVKNYIELDIDGVVGYPEVLRIRKVLERGTGIPCIPCWHNTRTKEDFIQTCKDYDYVSHGSAKIEFLAQENFQVLNWFADTAHAYGTKFHCMGFTQLKWLPHMHFDSVDSKSWKVGGMTGRKIFYFLDGEMKHVENKGMTAVTTWQERDEQNLKAWIDFVNFMDGVKT